MVKLNPILEDMLAEFSEDDWKAHFLKAKPNDNSMMTSDHEGMSFSILETKARQSQSLPSEVSWKKASVSYIKLGLPHLRSALVDDLNNGVRNFYFRGEYLTEQNWSLIESVLIHHQDLTDIEVFILGEVSFNLQSQHVKVITDLITADEVAFQGGSSTQELALLSKKLIEKATNSKTYYLGVYVGSSFFHNIAKIRSLKLLTLKILNEIFDDNSDKNLEKPLLRIVALTHFEGWTLYDRHSNMLRNLTAVASSYIGGADYVQSSGFNSLFEREDLLDEKDLQNSFQKTSHRMARNTTHILSLESFLGIVQDASHGSFYLENLTQKYCKDSWSLMQDILVDSEILKQKISETRELKLKKMKTRKMILSGVNDFPDVHEKLNLSSAISYSKDFFFRPARIFEHLRIRMENLSESFPVYVALFGDYAALNPRLNFIKNFFGVLGLRTFDEGRAFDDPRSFHQHLQNRQENIVVLCAKDDDYPSLSTTLTNDFHFLKFIAGRYQALGWSNIFAGQDIYEVLVNLSNDILSKKEGEFS